jgi:hypothetical protein
MAAHCIGLSGKLHGRRRTSRTTSERDYVNRKTALSVVVLFVCVLALGGCKREGAAASGNAAQHEQTQTIAPAAAQPAPTGTDAMTQTVEVEDSRSEEDGGVLTNGQSTAKTGAAATATTATTATTGTTTKTQKKH